MIASEIRRAAAAAAGSNLRDPLYGESAWDGIRAYMLAQGCKPEQRDVSSAWQSTQLRWGWLAPDGSWTRCDGARRAADLAGV